MRPRAPGVERERSLAPSYPTFMQIDWTHFSPASGFAGGLLIGVATGAFVLLLGRIAGISGIIGGLLRATAGDRAWRVAFLAGMLLSPVIYALVTALPAITIATSYPVVLAGGALVGIGTRLGGGCTSGHGVCGISRGSRRSIAATVIFMVAGFATVFVVRHVLANVS